MAENDPKIEDEFEYNDGLGDMLREREKHEFSWPKTLSFVLGIVLVVVIVILATFNATDSFFGKKSDQAVQAVPVESISLEDLAPGKPVGASAEATTTSQEAQTAATSEPPQQANAPDSASQMANSDPVPASSDRVDLGLSQTTQPAVAVQPKPEPKPVVQQVKKVSAKFKVIAGSFKKYDNAKRHVAKLQKQTISSFVAIDGAGANVKYRVQAGAFQTYADALKHARALNAKGINSFVLSN